MILAGELTASARGFALGIVVPHQLVATVATDVVEGVHRALAIFVDNPSAGPDGIPGNADDVQNNLDAVRQIRFTVNVRSLELNAARQPYRSTMTSTFSTRNLGYDAN